jgi:hypothetical protein
MPPTGITSSCVISPIVNPSDPPQKNLSENFGGVFVLDSCALTAKEPTSIAISIVRFRLKSLFIKTKS